MVLSNIRLPLALVCAAAFAGTLLLDGPAVQAGEPYFQGGCPTATPYQYGRPDLFANYYVPPVNDGVGGSMYLAPRPVPAYVGNTYVTYQPVMPHELLYKHDKTYHRYYDDGRGLTRTHVSWHGAHCKDCIHHVHHCLKIPR